MDDDKNIRSTSKQIENLNFQKKKYYLMINWVFRRKIIFVFSFKMMIGKLYIHHKNQNSNKIHSKHTKQN